MESVQDLLMDVGDSLNEGEVEEIVFLLKDYLQGKLVVINTKKAGGKKKTFSQYLWLRNYKTAFVYSSGYFC